MNLTEQSTIKSRERVAKHAEVFTPHATILDMIDLISPENLANPDMEFFEPSCGNGRFLVELFKARVEAGVPLEAALNTLHGLDIQKDNVHEARVALARVAVDKALTREEYNVVTVKGDFTKARRLAAIIQNNIRHTYNTLEELEQYKAGTGKLYRHKYVYEVPNNPLGKGGVLHKSRQVEVEYQSRGLYPIFDEAQIFTSRLP